MTTSESTDALPRRTGLVVIVALVPLVLDFVTKQIALAHFSADEPVRVLGGLLRFSLVTNGGAAFSIGEGSTWLFSLVKFGVICGMLWFSLRIRSRIWAVTFGLIMGGAAGNLVDRVFRAPAPLEGRVVDWIQLPNWPVFNVADMAVVCGGALVVWASFRGINMDGTIESDEPAESARKD
ncbi:signal peptidase II [Streptomyces sp. NPDC021096]|uniref:signal peptidase II n=1 Tax=Streptomyces sp. NPDC021096 TaxID=3154792 RepID=UPI0033F13D45